MKKPLLLLPALLLVTFSCKKQEGTAAAEKGYVVSTFAGSSGSGFADGTGSSIQFNSPNDIAIDGSGVLYVTDVYNERIRKISPAGTSVTYAGNGLYGYVDGTASVAQFKDPLGIGVDASGNVYVADYTNQRIRKITPAGLTSTLAGDGSAGFLDAPGLTAKFNFMADVAVDAAGNVFVADQYNHRIRKITPAGVVTTFVGSATPGTSDGSGASAQFGFPIGIVFDNGSGNLYVTDYTNNNIRKITSSGDVITLAGSSTAGFADGKGSAAMFKQPRGLGLDASGNIYVADSGNNRIRKVTPAGVVTTIAGNGTAGFAEGAAAVAQFNNPSGVAVDAAGNIFVADRNNLRIREIIFQ